MTASRQPNRLIHWLLIAAGLAVLAVQARQIYFSMGAGLLQFHSSKYGINLYGVEAAIVHLALAVAVILLVGIGLRGLRHTAGA